MKLLMKSLMLGSALTLSACGGAQEAADDMAMEEVAPAVGTIVDVAAGNPDFATLVTAVTAADLAGTLASEGPFTVFAPTNAAFAKVPSETLSALLAPEGKEQLTGILTYHVVAGDLRAQAVLDAIEAGGGTAVLTTVNGAEISASLVDGSVVLTDAAGNSSTVVMTDVDASNGVIHVIDTVVMPG